MRFPQTPGHVFVMDSRTVHCGGGRPNEVPSGTFQAAPYRGTVLRSQPPLHGLHGADRRLRRQRDRGAAALGPATSTLTAHANLSYVYPDQ